MFINPDWFLLNRTNHIVRIRCIPNYEQEPYYFLKKGDHTPLFDERFVNYGYNKMQHMRHLTYVGYQFSILINSYAMDMPHVKSKLKESYLQSQQEMKHLYHSFLYNRSWISQMHPRAVYCKASNTSLYIQYHVYSQTYLYTQIQLFSCDLLQVFSVIGMSNINQGSCSLSQ